MGDLHAEVLARRAFLRFLFLEAAKCVSGAPALVLEHQGNSSGTDNYRFQLKDGVSFHFYSSSVPCGNAAVKRRGKGSSGVEDQGAFLVKSTVSSDVVPPGTLPLGTSPFDGHWGEKRSVERAPLTCSDKLAVWNAIGLQGAMLVGVMPPVFIETFIAGWRLSGTQCVRALCRRLQGFTPTLVRGLPEPYGIHHVPVVGSSVRAAPRVISELSANLQCLTWTHGEETAEVLDGRTGLTLDGDVPRIAPNTLRTLASWLHPVGESTPRDDDIDDVVLAGMMNYHRAKALLRTYICDHCILKPLCVLQDKKVECR